MCKVARDFTPCPPIQTCGIRLAPDYGVSVSSPTSWSRSSSFTGVFCCPSFQGAYYLREWVREEAGASAVKGAKMRKGSSGHGGPCPRQPWLLGVVVLIGEWLGSCQGDPPVNLPISPTVEDTVTIRT